MQPDDQPQVDSPGAPMDADLQQLAQACVDAANTLTAAQLAVSTAQAGLTDAITARAQCLSDMANALGAAGITAPAFTFGGYTFTFGTATASVMPTPPDLGELGGAP